MSLLLKDRDYVRDGNGGVAVARDGEALVNEALFRLTARRESFPFLPGLGSRMGELRRGKSFHFVEIRFLLCHSPGCPGTSSV